MQTITDILNLKVSYQANTWSDITTEQTIASVLNDIKSTKYKTQITTLRTQLESGNKEYYDNYKKQLPAVTFSAAFNKKRTNENLKIYNSVIVIDIDKLNDEQININFQQLKNDEYVISFWRSPSNKGYKGLVAVEYEIDNHEFSLEKLHKSAFNKLSDYFQNKYNIELDKSGSDITRLCFLSFDNNMILKNKFKKFIIENTDIIFTSKKEDDKTSILKFSSNKDALYNPSGKNRPVV